MRTTGPTLHQVAKLAGVSIATVSRVMRDIGPVTEVTRRKVEAAIDELDYRPSHLGQALVNRRHGTLAIVFPGLSGPYYSEVIHGYERRAIESQMSLLILGPGGHEHSERLTLDLANRTDGLAILGSTIADATILRLAQRSTPLVTVARRPLAGIPNVRVDNTTTTRELVLHLIHVHGCQSLAYIGSTEESSDGADRWQGLLDACREADVTPPAAPFDPAWDQRSGAWAGTRLLQREPLPDAIVCGSDEIATGVLSALASQGVRVPGDVLVTGWDDGPSARYMNPPLTTVFQPAEQLGYESATQLLRRLDQADPVADDQMLTTRLVIRSSCGCTYDPKQDFQPFSHKEAASM
jgi:LacI family transcriptional regulator